MKKVSIILLAVFLTASYAHAQFTFGVRAGFNLTNVSESYDGEKPDKDERYKFTPGFQIGVVGDYAISDAISIQPGLLFAQQGAKIGWDDDSDAKLVIGLNYLQVPINVQYKLDLGGANLLLQAGPYLGFGLGGKLKFWDEKGKRVSDDDLKKLEDEDDWWKFKMGGDEKKHDLKGLDFGIGLGAGVQFGAIQVGVGYNLGLANMSFGEKEKWTNNGLALTVTYLFGN